MAAAGAPFRLGAVPSCPATRASTCYLGTDVSHRRSGAMPAAPEDGDSATTGATLFAAASATVNDKSRTYGTRAVMLCIANAGNDQLCGDPMS